MLFHFLRLRNLALALALLASAAQPVQAHAAPSACNVTVTKAGRNTITELFVTHVADGDMLSLMWSDATGQHDRRAYHGYSSVGTNVKSVVVKNSKGVLVCSA